jgi:2-polyprenyl-3-methyl-5-hydroxy-6-metoxy-1,4-benzoquinol methylase
MAQTLPLSPIPAQTATEWLSSERQRLETIASESWYAKGVNATTIEYSARIFARHWQGTQCLELGPAEGMMTSVLVSAFPHVMVVEGSARFCSDLAARFPKIEVVHSLFESFQPQQGFDTIVLGHVMEHVESPQELLKRMKHWLNPDGVICAAVPNARSIHRQAAVIMGLLPAEDALNETDLHHGHRRVYNPETFRAEFLSAGLKIKIFGGYWIKPISNAQLEQSWTPAMVEAFMQLGERYPDVAAENYVIATA